MSLCPSSQVVRLTASVFLSRSLAVSKAMRKTKNPTPSWNSDSVADYSASEYPHPRESSSAYESDLPDHPVYGQQSEK